MRSSWHAGRTLAESDWAFSWRDFPHPAFGSDSLVGLLIGPFLFAANMFGFVLVVSHRLCHACMIIGLCIRRQMASCQAPTRFSAAGPDGYVITASPAVHSPAARHARRQ